MRLLGQAAGSSPLSLVVPSKVLITDARCPARSDPANNQSFCLRQSGECSFRTGCCVCLAKVHLIRRCKSDPAFFASARITWSGAGGNECAEALQEKDSLGDQ